ncbi:hypothetical protein BsWGS_03916 [Bradybaena similaris]
MRAVYECRLLVAALCVHAIVFSVLPPAAAQTTESPQDSRHRQQIKCTMRNQLSSKGCETVVISQTSENDDLSKGCAKLESFKNLVAAVGCTQEDYNRLHLVICTWDGKSNCVDYYTMQLNEIAAHEKNLSAACSKSISKDVKNEVLPDYCTKLKSVEEGLISQQFCTAQELAGLEKFVCCDKEVCFLNIDTSTRRGQVELAIRKTSSKCSMTMAVALDELSQSPDKACPVLEATRPALQGDLICTDQDYIDLRKVVCVHEVNCSVDSTASACTTTTPDPFASEKDQRDRIQKVIAGELNSTCQSFMIEQAGQSINDPLEKTCKNFLDNYGFIVIGGQCSEEEYGKLKFAICGSAKLVSANMTLFLASCFFAFHRMFS